jgi:hypothetical protein
MKHMSFAMNDPCLMFQSMKTCILQTLAMRRIKVLLEGEVVTTIEDDSNGKEWKHGHLRDSYQT